MQYEKNITQYLRSGSLEYLESAIQRGLHYEEYIQIESNRRLTLHTKEEFEEKFYRVTGVCISSLKKRTRQQLYNELGMVLTRGVTEDKLKQIILGVF